VDGSNLDLIMIPIMGLIAISAWVIVVFVADAPWKSQRTAAAREVVRLAKLEVFRLAQRSDAVFAEPAHRAVIIPRPSLGLVQERQSLIALQSLSAVAGDGTDVLPRDAVLE
jgi:hypothetical protein